MSYFRHSSERDFFFVFERHLYSLCIRTRYFLKELKVPIEGHNFRFVNQGSLKIRKERSKLLQNVICKSSVKPSKQSVDRVADVFLTSSAGGRWGAPWSQYSDSSKFQCSEPSVLISNVSSLFLGFCSPNNFVSA